MCVPGLQITGCVTFKLLLGVQHFTQVKRHTGPGEGSVGNALAAQQTDLRPGDGSVANTLAAQHMDPRPGDDSVCNAT